MFNRLGVRGRLLMAFFGISAFAVLAAGAATYSFFEVSDVVNRITQRRVPLALASLELSRHTERIVAVAPALLAVGTPEEHAELSSKIKAQLARLDELFANLKTGDIDAESLKTIEYDVRWLHLNLTNLDSLIAGQISSAEYMEELIDDVAKSRRLIDRLLAPGRTALDEYIARLRRTLENPALSLDDRIRRSAELAEVVSLSLLLHDIRANATSVENGLLQAAVAQDAENLARLSTSLRQSAAVLEGLATGLYVVDREGLAEEISTLQDLVKSRGGIVRTRQYDLDNIANGRQLLLDSAEASRQLTEAVDRLVEAANRDIEQAGLDADAVQRVATWVLIAAVVLSLVSSTLIVWLYVGRNLIARLTALSNSMLAIAGGNLKADLPAGGADEIGRMAEALIVFRDTAVEVEEANLREIQETRRRLTDAIESISEGFSLYDADDRLVVCNSMYRKILYPDTEEPIQPGTAFEDVIRRAAQKGYIRDAEGHIDDWVGRRLARHKAPSGPHVQQRGDGRWIQVSERKTENGGTVAVYTDITELKKAEQAAEQASRAKSTFLANMSHELRTPLNAIMGFSDVLIDRVDTDGPPPMLDPLKRIRGAGEHLLHLINEVLDLSKIEAGKMELEIGTVPLPPVVHDAMTTVRPLAEANRNRLVVNCPDDVGSVRADPVRLRQTLLNLLSNASKFTEDGEITVTVVRNGQDQRDLATIAVTDTGIGLTPDQAGQLFADFAQVDSLSTRKHEGTGLGLAISRRFCRMMGGDITVESETGKGSTFTVHLPVADDDADWRLPAPPAEVAPPVQPRPKFRADAGSLVLVVDDDASARELLELVLTKEGYKVAVAVDGNEGLRLARQLQPAVIILDALMPHPDGWAVLMAVKSDPDISDIPVIMVTIVDDATRGYTLGVIDYLTKPVDRNRLLAVVARCATAPVEPSILLVEDDQDSRQLIREMLEPAGCSIVEAGNGKVALERLAEAVPDLILLDLMMPEMNGFEFLAALRDDPTWHAVPVVVVTAGNLTEADKRRLNGAVDQVLQKGAFRGIELLQEIRRAIKASIQRRVETRPRARRRILYVEDNEDNILLLKTRLEERGYDVTIARDGEQGVAAAKDELPALILMDMRLPVMDGWAATQALKASRETQAIPVIGLSAHAMAGDRERALAAGCDDYVTKPVDLPQLMAKLEDLLVE